MGQKIHGQWWWWCTQSCSSWLRTGVIAVVDIMWVGWAIGAMQFSWTVTIKTVRKQWTQGMYQQCNKVSYSEITLNCKLNEPTRTGQCTAVTWVHTNNPSRYHHLCTKGIGRYKVRKGNCRVTSRSGARWHHTSIGAHTLSTSRQQKNRVMDRRGSLKTRTGGGVGRKEKNWRRTEWILSLFPCLSSIRLPYSIDHMPDASRFPGRFSRP